MTDDGYDDKIVVHQQTWSGLLERIRQRPGMYLGSASLEALHLFVQGFSAAEVVYSVPELRRREVNDFPWAEFESYVAGRYNEHRLSLNSFGLAQYDAQGREIGTFKPFHEYEGAWEIWWRWHDEFIAS